MNEGDTRSSATETRLLIHEMGALSGEMRQRCFDVGDGQGDVMDTLAPAVEEPPNVAVGGERRHQLHERATDRHHRLFHTLLGHYFS